MARQSVIMKQETEQARLDAQVTILKKVFFKQFFKKMNLIIILNQYLNCFLIFDIDDQLF